MELWIRSQDKTQLAQITGLLLNDNKIRGFTNYHQNYYELGTYKTKERALELLDEIQRILIPKGIIKFDSLLKQEDIETLRKHFDNNYTVVNKNVELLQPFETLVYEMPKEW